jgi:hypothetical protein
MPSAHRKEEVERNFAAFLTKLPDLLQTHQGKFAIMHKQEIVEFCDTFGDSLLLAKALFPNSEFSVQEVRAIYGGNHAYAVHQLPD